MRVENERLRVQLEDSNRRVTNLENHAQELQQTADAQVASCSTEIGRLQARVRELEVDAAKPRSAPGSASSYSSSAVEWSIVYVIFQRYVS